MSFSFVPAFGDQLAEKRTTMVAEQIIARGVDDPHVLEAMRAVARHEFVPAQAVPFAYADRPLPIGYEQTISQPYIVALMSERLRLHAGEKVLEIGTGSGYQTAILAQMGCDVYSIEIIPELAHQARETLDRLGYTQVHVRAGDGYVGWKEEAPFDAIIITAAAPHIPEPLIDQLRVGGRMIVPVTVEGGYQMLRLLAKSEEGTIKEEDIIPVRFVPLVRE